MKVGSTAPSCLIILGTLLRNFDVKALGVHDERSIPDKEQRVFLSISTIAAAYSASNLSRFCIRRVITHFHIFISNYVFAGSLLKGNITRTCPLPKASPVNPFISGRIFRVSCGRNIPPRETKNSVRNELFHSQTDLELPMT